MHIDRMLKGSEMDMNSDSYCYLPNSNVILGTARYKSNTLSIGSHGRYT